MGWRIARSRMLLFFEGYIGACIAPPPAPPRGRGGRPGEGAMLCKPSPFLKNDYAPPPDIRKLTTPATISRIPASLRKFSDSPNTHTPIAAMAAVPTADQMA